jgi:hypothetical protein
MEQGGDDKTGRQSYSNRHRTVYQDNKCTQAILTGFELYRPLIPSFNASHYSMQLIMQCICWQNNAEKNSFSSPKNLDSAPALVTTTTLLVILLGRPRRRPVRSNGARFVFEVYELSLVLDEVVGRIGRILALQAEIEIVVIGVVSASTTVLGQSTELEYGGVPVRIVKVSPLLRCY